MVEKKKRKGIDGEQKSEKKIQNAEMKAVFRMYIRKIMVLAERLTNVFDCCDMRCVQKDTLPIKTQSILDTISQIR